MKIQGTHKFKSDPEALWDLLMDADALAATIPGCQELVETEPGRFDAKLRVGVAAVKGEFSGSVKMEDVNRPSDYRLIIEGSGAPGFLKGTAQVRLEPEGDRTVLRLDGEAQVGGVIAGVGQRMLGGVAKLLMGQFRVAENGCEDV
ncbi:MAG: carbon monoxide dehydrogenase subunit G, partial [Nitrospinota bacterium]